MGFFDLEKSVFGGKPVELFRFAMGSSLWLYTNGSEDVQVDGDKYKATYIAREGFVKSGDTSKSSVNIKISYSDPLALEFMSGWLQSIMIVTIYRHHVNDSDFNVIWKGRVTNCKWTGSTAVLTSDSMFSILRRSGLRRVFQVSCPHVLYDSNSCRVQQNSYRVPGVIGAKPNNNTISVAAALYYPAGYFTGGKVLCNGSLRMVVGHSGNALTLVDGGPEFSIGSTVQMWPGCDRTLNTCASKFSNTDNFGGMPYLPANNPFSGDALV